MKKIKNDVLLDVAYEHTLKDKKYVLHPRKNTTGRGKNMYSIIKKDTTTPNEYLTDDEFAEILAINGFEELGIKVRMWPSNGEYGSNAPPVMTPTLKNLVPASKFSRLVEQKEKLYRSSGLSSDVTNKLEHIGIFVRGSTGAGSISFESDMASENESFPGTGANGIRQPMSIEEFQAQLDRRSEIGEAGERIALDREWQRLGSREVGCPDPKRYVEHVALTDVGRGYDIETTWPGHERCIEVKSSTSSGNDIFMSDNEKRVLTELGDRAWLYRVVVDANGDGEVVLRLNDPISKIPKENISTAVWRVRLPKSDE